MYWMIRALFALLAAGGLSIAQQNPNWSRPFPPYKIAGNVYYVGTADLACFLLTTPEGDILINTGLADSGPLIRASMQKLGYNVKDIRILLTMQAHSDHVGAFKEIQQDSGAKIYITEPDAPALEDGGRSPGGRLQFPPVKVDRKLRDGDVVRLGGIELTVILTPGHSKGSVSYATTVLDGGKKRSLLFANMETVVMPLVGNANYPQIVDDYERAFKKQRQLSPEIWLAAHASQYDMEAKMKSGSFVDPAGYKTAVEHYEKLFHEQLDKERRQAGLSK
jgi:metallo-beta-lactamase class B